MKTSIDIPYGLPDGMQDRMLDFGMEFTEFIAYTTYAFLLTGAMANEIYLHVDVRMK